MMSRPEFSIEYAAERSRLTNLFRVILAIPHLVISNAWTQLVQVLTFFQWLVILFTGSRNESMWKMQDGWLGYNARVQSYLSLMFDKWPEIGPEPNGEPTRYSFAFEKSAGRLSNFFRLLLAVPALVVAVLALIAAVVCTIASLMAILITGRHPRPLFDFVLGVHRYLIDVSAYLMLMTDEYPKYGR